MFTCSICDETLGEGPIYTTLCGHVFHSKCIFTWLGRKQNCPQCRATVRNKDLIKIFLEDNSNACIPQNGETLAQELNILKNRLKILQNNMKNDENLIIEFRSELEDLKTNSAKDLEFIRVLNTNCLFDQDTINNLRSELARITNDFNNLQDLKICSEKKRKLEKLKCRSLEKDIHEMQSIHSIAIDKLNSEIADLKSEKAYFQEKCHSLEMQNKLPSTSKVKIENENTLFQDNRIENKYFGHDPKLTLPSKKFLLGCVFLFLGDSSHFEDLCSDSFMFKLNIIEHGGAIELLYSSHITHIICGTQKHHLVKQGIKDGKRCVTDYWLNDIITKKCMLPPWLAYHFPLPYSNETNLPCEHFQIAIANFEESDYHIVNAMIKLTGARVLNQISSSTDVVVSKNLCGDMIDTAFALKRPVVNVQWLNDILFGAVNGIKNPENIKYQQFNSNDPFFVNYDMVSHLMEAWKIPVTFLQNIEVYDLCGSSPGPSACKKQKTQAIVNEVIDLVDDECSNDITITYVGIDPKKKPCVLFSGFEIDEEEELQQIVIELGGKIASHCQEGTHLVMNKPSQTQQFLSCLTTINHVVGVLWLRISRLHNRFDDEKKYYINEVYDDFDRIGRKIVCNVPKVLQNTERQKLFEHKIFYVSPNIDFPSDCLKQIIRSAGGTVEEEIKNMMPINDEAVEPNTYFIISCADDINLINSVIDFKIVIYRPDLITNAIMQQRINPKQHVLL